MNIVCESCEDGSNSINDTFIRWFDVYHNWLCSTIKNDIFIPRSYIQDRLKYDLMTLTIIPLIGSSLKIDLRWFWI